MDGSLFKYRTKVVQVVVENYLQIVKLEGSVPSLGTAVLSQTFTAY